jgi:hypothetical protein
MRSAAVITAVGLSLIMGAIANKDAITLITNGNSWIKEAVATLVLPELPDSVTGDIALWSAIMMDDYNGDFLQGVTSSSPAYVWATDHEYGISQAADSINSGSYCGYVDGQWCNFAYKLRGIDDGSKVRRMSQANSLSQMEAQQPEMLLSPNLGPESGHTVSTAVLRVEYEN